MQKQEMRLTKRLENWKPRAQFDVKSNTKYQRWKEQFTIKFSSHISFCSNLYGKKCWTTTKRKQKAQVDKNRKTYVLAAPTCDKAACIFLNNFLHTSFLNTICEMFLRDRATRRFKYRLSNRHSLSPEAKQSKKFISPEADVFLWKPINPLPTANFILSFHKQSRFVAE